MKQNLIKFIHRGAIFGGFGPVITAIIYLILSFSINNFSVSGYEMFSAIISTYFLAFVHAGASAFNEIESWSIGKSTLCHFITLYVAYSLCYIINSWIPFDITILLIFTVLFVLVYLIIALTVYLITKKLGKKLNESLNK